MIILEGPDGSGKSTLANWLHEQTGMPIYHSSRAPKNEDELDERLFDSVAIMKIPGIQDRTPWVSEPIYGLIKSGDQTQSRWAYYQAVLILLRPILIYCRPPLETIEEYAGQSSDQDESVSYLNWVVENMNKLVLAYDSFMGQVPLTITYDWTTKDAEKKRSEILRLILKKSTNKKHD